MSIVKGSWYKVNRTLPAEFPDRAAIAAVADAEKVLRTLWLFYISLDFPCDRQQLQQPFQQQQKQVGQRRRRLLSKNLQLKAQAQKLLQQKAEAERKKGKAG